VVECDLAKVEVAGSNPVSRSKSSKVPRAGRELFLIFRQSSGGSIRRVDFFPAYR